MSVEDILAKLRFSDNSQGESPTAAEINALRGIITQIYSTAAGKEVLDVLLTPAHSNTKLIFQPNNGDGNAALLGDFEILYDFEQPDATFFIDNDGTYFQPTMVEMIAHELFHAIAGAEDLTVTNGTTPGTDYMGDAVRFENTVMHQLGYETTRNSYLSGLTQEEIDSLGPLLEPGSVNLFDPVNPGSILVDNLGWDAFDTSDRSDNLILIGVGGNDSIKSGSGDDILYGGVGDDTLQGGDGSDFLFGNADADILVGGAGRDVFMGGAGDDVIVSGSVNSIADIPTTSPHPEWDDNFADWIEGGEGQDTIYMYGSAQISGGRGNPNYLSYRLDLDQVYDPDFDAYIQFTIDGATNTAHISDDMIRSAMNNSQERDTLGSFWGTNNSELVEVIIKGEWALGDRYNVWAEWNSGEFASSLADFSLTVPA